MSSKTRASTPVLAGPIGDLPKVQRDFLPVLLVPLLALVAFPLVGNASSWATLTIAALAMGMMIFVMASGLR